MNILFLAKYYAPHVGGVEKHVFEISKILSRRHNIKIVALQHDPSLPKHESTPVADIYRLQSTHTDKIFQKLEIWYWFWQHRDLLEWADTIHVHDVFFWILPLRFMFHSKKFYITFHGYEGSNPPRFKQILWHKIGELLTSGNICIGNFHQKWYHTRPTLVSFGAAAHVPGAVRPQNKAIFLGRLDKDTGIMDYLSAIAASPITTDIYGDGPQMQLAARFSEANKLPVKFYGFEPNASRYLPKYSIAFTSRYLGIIEALQARVPVVAHYDSAIKYDYLADSPFAEYIYICGSPEEIAYALTRIKKNKRELKQKIESGYNWSTGQTWQKLACEYESLWIKKSATEVSQ